MLQWSNW